MTHALKHLIASGRLNQAFINGQWVTLDTPRSKEVINPATEQPIASIALGTSKEVDAAVTAAQAAFETWSQTSVDSRLAILDKIYELMMAQVDSLAEVLSQEMGAAISYAKSAHVPLAAAHIKTARDNLAKYDFVTLRGTTAIAREPIGVCGLITPWNWPLYQITAKVGPALATGCTVVLKPSELSPLSALLFAEIVQQAGVPAGVFNLVNGDGEGVGAPLSSHPQVDMISITGSTRAGVLVAQAAAPTVKRVGQELGGKSANILLPDADFETAVGLGIAACFRNVGQSCSAPTRMLVPRDKLAEVEKLAIEASTSIVVGDPTDEASTHGPVANLAQFTRVQHMIQVGIDEGARLLCGGTGKPDGLETGYYAKPTIFSDVQENMAIAQEEIFGPVLAILPYDDIEHAIRIANNSVYGLSAHVQSRDLQQARKVAARIRSGQVLINYPAWDSNAPFGGYKLSGTGREYGIEGLEEYLETKAIVGFGNEPALSN